MLKSIAEIVEEAASKSAIKDKIQTLVDNDSPALRFVLCVAYHPLIKWEVTGQVNYQANPLEWDQEGVLYKEVRRLYLFLKPNHVFHQYAAITKEKRDNLYIQFLEMLDRKDARLIQATREKRVHVPGLGQAVVEAAFPGIISFPEVPEEKVLVPEGAINEDIK